MPRVTRKDGIFSRVTNSPLNNPISAATTRLIRNATPSDVRPALNSVHMTTGANPNSEPTERSNSPAVIKQRHRQRDEPELDREGQGVADIEDGQEVGIDRGEDRELEHEQHERAELWRRNKTSELRLSASKRITDGRADGGDRKPLQLAASTFTARRRTLRFTTQDSCASVQPGANASGWTSEGVGAKDFRSSTCPT